MVYMNINFKKRVPEKHQEMDDYNEILTYYKAHQILKKKHWDIYNLISKNILNNIKIKEGKILDVACGYGGLMNSLKNYRKKLNFTGIDISKSMIKVGKKYISDKRINFFLMPADNMKFPGESFDYVLCKDAFHHFKNPMKVLKEMFRVLKKGGYIYAIDLRRDIPEKIVYQIVQSASQLNIQNAILYLESHKASYTISEMKKLIRKAGIKRYKIFTPKIEKNFLTYYNLKNEDYLLASDYLKDKWVLIIKK